ncbi:MAG: hypothetical protein R2755_10835 [Acidimicrobiales bacterium]
MVAIEFTALDPDSTATAAWRIDRVSFTTADRPAASLELHPRLNVVVVDEDRVDDIAAKLRTALSHGADGTHVEFTLTDGPSLVAFRPIGGRHRLIDIASAEERPLDLLEELAGAGDGLDAGGDGDGDGDVRAVVAALSRLDQQALWTAAGRVLTLRTEAGADADGASLPDGERPTTIDLRAQPKRRLLRRWAKASAPGTDDLHAQLAAATRAWHDLAGPIEPEVALRQRDRSEAAARVLVRMGALAAVSAETEPSSGVSVVPGGSGDGAAIDAVCALVPVRRPGGGPHIVPIPATAAAEGELTTLLLDHLAALSGDRQIVVVTGDESVIDWARLEHHARRAALLRLDAEA